jgi:hypothetical protein
MNRRRNNADRKARRRVALIGIAAILFQALLFGWHHHGVAAPGDAGPTASVQAAAQPLAPAIAEDLCHICVVLHQQNTAPAAFFVAPVPLTAANPDALLAAILHDRAAIRGFDARAPPQA